MLSQSGLPHFWLLCDGKDPTRIGFGLRVELEIACPGFAWVYPPRAVDGDRFLGLFRAPDLQRARAAASLVAALGDALTKVWPADFATDAAQAA